MQENYSIGCSPIEVIDGIEAFIVHLNRKSGVRSGAYDRLSVQMPGHIILRNIGFDESEYPKINRYIDDHLEILVDIALDNTEKMRA